MIIIPAIDLINGQTVRLKKGDFRLSETYNVSPDALIQKYIAQGARAIHIVDLDQAKNPENDKQKELIMRLAQTYPISIQTGGGIRNEHMIERLLNSGVERIIIGSLAVWQPQQVMKWIHAFGAEHFTLSLDARLMQNEWKVAVAAWQELSDIALESLIQVYNAEPNLSYLITDIDKDGMLKGPNLDLYTTLRAKFPDINLQASGGIRHLADLKQLNAIGCQAAIVGKALLTHQFSLTDIKGGIL